MRTEPDEDDEEHPPSDPVADEWGTLHGARTGTSGLIVAAIPMAALLHWRPSTKTYVFLVLWLFSLVVGIFALRAFRCPRCKQPFGWSSRSRNLFTKTCVHCGIRIDERWPGAPEATNR